jgi:hypothetical protein
MTPECFSCKTQLNATNQFELHLTVQPLAGAAVEHFRTVVSSLGIKPLLIGFVNDAPNQPMTCSRVRGTIADAIKTARDLSQQLRTHGFLVERVKIEAAPSNSGVPLEDGQHTGYFEHHAKVLMSGAEMKTLQQLAQTHQAHVSRSAFKTRSDGWLERFVTLRGYQIGLATSEKRFAALRDSLTEGGFTVLDFVSEYCLYDTAPDLDATWYA